MDGSKKRRFYLVGDVSSIMVSVQGVIKDVCKGAFDVVVSNTAPNESPLVRVHEMHRKGMQFDIIIVIAHVNAKDGGLLISQIKEEFNKIPIILLSDCDEPKGHGADGYVDAYMVSCHLGDLIKKLVK